MKKITKENQAKSTMNQCILGEYKNIDNSIRETNKLGASTLKKDYLKKKST